MIFKKPYAFFIKNFKLFHLIICGLAAILLYRTSLVYSFIFEFIKTNPNVIGKELTDVLFVNWVYILILLILAVNIIIIVVMIRKEKPFMYYVLNISLYVGVLIVYVVSHKVISNLEVMLVETKTVLAIRDILNLARMLETISIIFYLIRATGFDIRKFDFVRDLQGLDISDEDSEEYEVAVEFEKNLIVRNIKKNLRGAKYYYKENKFIINIISMFILGMIFLVIYMNINKYNRVYQENEYININGVDFGVTNSFIVNKDYRGDDLVSDNATIVVRFASKSYGTNIIPASKFVLTVNGNNYYHIKDYASSLIDLGTVYSEQQQASEFKDYLLVYSVPKEVMKKKMILKYIDRVEQKHGKAVVNSIDIKLNLVDIDGQKQVTEMYGLSQEVNMTSDFSSYKLVINDYELAPRFYGTYNVCISNSSCYDFKEILTPSVLSNKSKVLLKLNGSLYYDKGISSVTDLYDFIDVFGSIEYGYNGNFYTASNDFNLVKFNKINDDNFYIQVDKEIMDADVIRFVFNLRNRRYVYVLKGDVNG